MNLISILDHNTINQIAAGEIVERPTSIIKELVENSIDADSTAITIEIKDGGKSYIRVTDNGKGMSSNDAKLSFKRHATSKIGSSKDLENISTLGFRGEALASIAAVTQMEMITREENTISGIQIINHGGNIVSEKEIGSPEGTTIITQNLFFNTPARLKFLKSSRTETGHISDLVSKLILAHPEISFKYINNGKLIYYSSGDGVLKNAILSIYGKDVVDQILAIETLDNANNITLLGYLGKPSLSRKNRSHQSFFVNGRYVKSKFLGEIIDNIYKPYLTINQFPWIVLNVDIDPRLVDVNVHPAKTEVRFREGEILKQVLEQNIGGILKKNPYIPSLSKDAFEPSTVSKSSITDINEKDNQLDDYELVEDQIELLPSISNDSSNRDIWIVNQENEDGHVSKGTSLQENNKDVYRIPPSENPNSDQSSKENIGMDINGQANNRDLFVPLKIVGKLFSTYIVVEGDKQCYLIDQHAAHERLLFEKYKIMLSDQAVATQQLLPPVVIEVTHSEEIIVNESLELFHLLGFDIEPFGSRSFAIRGVPLILGSSNAKEFFEELLDNIESFSQGSNYQLKIDEVIRMSCKKAVKAGDDLSNMEVLALIRDIKEKKIPMTCPHGRPIMISLTQNELEKIFKRIQ